MHIVIFGTGGVGGTFGGYLAHAGIDVTFIARGEHLRTMQKDGLRIESSSGDFSVASVKATDDTRKVKNVDAILLCTKSWQLETIMDDIEPMLGPDTFIVPLQNSVEAPDILAAHFGKQRVLGGLCYTISYIVGPGVIHSGNKPQIVFGELNDAPSERTQELEKLLGTVSAIAVMNSSDIHLQMWKKFSWIASAGAVGAATQTPIGIWRAVPETRKLYESVLRETYAVAEGRGVTLPESSFSETMQFIDKRPENFITSMQRDIATGARSELMQQIGCIVRFGEELKVPVPYSAALYAALLPLELRAQGKIDFKD